MIETIYIYYVVIVGDIVSLENINEIGHNLHNRIYVMENSLNGIKIYKTRVKYIPNTC